MKAKLIEETLNEHKNKNVNTIMLTLDEMSFKKFKTIPTFKNLLHANQLQNLKLGENILNVNNVVFGTLKRMSRSAQYEVEKIDESLNENIKRNGHELEVLRTQYGKIYAGKDGIIGHNDIFISWPILKQIMKRYTS